METEFIPFEHDDVPEIIRMITESYLEYPQTEPVTKEKILHTAVHFEQNPGKGTIIKFVRGHDVAGYAILIFYWSNEYGGNIVFIDELFVKPEWRHNGIATQFIRSLIEGDMIHFPHIKGIQLEVTPSNQNALNFYRSLGFTHVRNANLFLKLSKKI